MMHIQKSIYILNVQLEKLQEDELCVRAQVRK